MAPRSDGAVRIDRPYGVFRELPGGGDESGDEISGGAPGCRAFRVEKSVFVHLLQGLRKATPLQPEGSDALI